ncbi:MAG: hypothetical protein R2860_04555 [Desulfobacterales bacterium]
MKLRLPVYKTLLCDVKKETRLPGHCCPGPTLGAGDDLTNKTTCNAVMRELQKKQNSVSVNRSIVNRLSSLRVFLNQTGQAFPHLFCHKILINGFLQEFRPVIIPFFSNK